LSNDDVVTTNPLGTEIPILVISPRFAPFPPATFIYPMFAIFIQLYLEEW